MRSFWCFLLFVFSTYSFAAVLPQAERDELIGTVLKNFWGSAKLSNGQIAQPSSGAERNTIPISKSVAHRSIDAGEISGLGEWCKLDWQSHYFSLTRAARKNGFNDKQVAFVSFLHGASQGRITSAMAKTSSCNDRDRLKVEQMLNQSKAKGLEGT